MVSRIAAHGSRPPSAAWNAPSSSLLEPAASCSGCWGRSAGFIYLLAGILLAPLGILGFIDDSHIIGRDTDFPTFIRTLGSVMGGKGIPMVQGFVEVDRASLPKNPGPRGLHLLKAEPGP